MRPWILINIFPKRTINIEMSYNNTVYGCSCEINDGCCRNHHCPHDDLPRAGGQEGFAQSSVSHSSRLFCLHFLHLHFLHRCTGIYYLYYLYLVRFVDRDRYRGVSGVDCFFVDNEIYSWVFKNSVKSWKHQTGGQWPGVYVCVLQTLNCLRKHHFDTDFNLTRQTLYIWLRVSSWGSKLISFSFHHTNNILLTLYQNDICFSWILTNNCWSWRLN